jgi:hypothetical protein
MDERIKSGRFRPCAHLVVSPFNEYPEGVNVLPTHIYLPQCNRDSFSWSQPRVDRQSEFDILRQMLHLEPIACPTNCRCFEHRYWGSAKRTGSKLLRAIRDLWGAFSRLPWQTQTLFVLLLILIFAPRWIPPIIELLHALR